MVGKAKKKKRDAQKLKLMGGKKLLEKLKQLVFGVHGLCSSLGVKIFIFSTSAIGSPKLIGDVCCTITVVAPPVFLP